ncbi:hypothetical protein ACLESD_22770 [Pyxidicoccus sp. 3LFB2]
MKRLLLVVAAVVGVSVVGCGGAEAEVPGPEAASQALESCEDLPTCAALTNQYCGVDGTQQDCCNGGYVLPCWCTSSGAWICA